MKHLRYRIALLLLVILYTIDVFDEHVLLWIGSPEDGVWKWVVEEGNTYLTILLILIIFFTQHGLLKRVKESEERYRILTEISPNSILVHRDGIVTYVNPSAVKILGAKSKDEVIGQDVFDFVPPCLKKETIERIEKLRFGKTLDFKDSKLVGVDGKITDVESVAALINFNGQSSIMAVGRDITERKKLERQLKESEEHYRKVVELSPNGIMIHKFGEIVYVNSAAVNILGASSKKELIGKNILGFSHPDYHNMIRKRWGIIKNDNKLAEFIEEKMIRLNNQIIDVEVAGLPVTINGERFVQIFFRDITERKKDEKLVYKLAYRDTLTGLPNRRFFEEKLNRVLKNAEANNKTVGVMFLDLDGFKRVNDTLGHDVGDSLLQQAAERLKGCVRENDIVSRLAGDEFTILLPEMNQKDAVKLAERILQSVEAPFIINDNEVKVTSSIGISYYSQGVNGEKLVKHADMAMYKAKQKGKNTYYIYGK